jgi:hypothetical protein
LARCFEYILRKGTNDALITDEERAVFESIFKERDVHSINYITFDAAEKVLKKSLGSLTN